MKILLLPQAEEDYAAIAEPLHSKITKRLRSLALYPSLGAALPEPYTGYRSTVVGIFRIVYRQPGPDLINISYIRDCRRSLP